MFDKQNGRCYICGTHQIYLNKALAVDHDHKTGVVRGLLCGNHNIGLGMFNDNYKILLKGALYLFKTQGKGENIIKVLEELQEKEKQVTAEVHI